MVQEVEAAWLAGLFDGDGSLNYERRAYRDDHRNQDSPGHWRLRVRIGTTCLVTADRLVELAGGTYHTGSTPAGRPNYTWAVANRLARTVLERIQPYVVTKKRRVDLALEAEAIRMSAKRRCGANNTGSAIVSDVHTQLERISDEIKSLNQKGPTGRLYVGVRPAVQTQQIGEGNEDTRSSETAGG